ncbi:C-C chemokine receptor type 1 [Oryzias melastigma]|uniref:C-C chemokine receptor type 1 n=1 Tax=Oryzias melastigma TaxID=30732 RepID=A0A834F3F6_ORYME|nr:C-C chemokine receptor type 1 [Oryzias melastigma]
MNPFTVESPTEAPEEYGTGTAVACVILGLSFLIGVPGNLFVIWTILRSMKRRSHTVMLILHLAVADTVVLITLPLWIYSMAHTWEFGEGTCKALVYFISTCMYSSIFFITLMSVERFVAISHPFVMLRWGNKNTEHEYIPEYLVFSSGALVFISSSVNPMLYAFFAKNFRGSLEGSRLVRLFQEMTTYTNKLRDLAVQQQSEQGPSTQEEFISDSTC